MSYPIQKIVADAIADFRMGKYSCLALQYKTCDILKAMYGDTPVPSPIVNTIETHIVVEYSVFSNANPQQGGFNGLHKTVTDHYSPKLFNYRLEMLYYFWMANQEM